MEHGDLYRQIVQSSTDGIVALALDGTIRFANASAKTLLRTSGLQGRHIDEFLDVAGRQHSREHLARAAQGSFIDDEVDTMLVRGDGTPLWVRLRQTGLREDDRYTGVILRLTDNHQTKQLLEAVYESRRQLMRAERIARSGSWTWDRTTRTVSHSEGLEELYGDHLADLVASDRVRLAAVTHPEDRPRLEEALDQLASGERPRVDLELRQRARSGWIWVRLRALGTYDSDGELVEVSGTNQDITRARDTEDQLQDLATQNSLMHAVAAAANEATTLDEVLAQAASMVVLHDDWDRARAFVPSPDGLTLVAHLSGDDLSGDDPTGDAPEREDEDVAVIERATAEECLRLGHSVWDEERRLTIAAPIRLGEQILAVITITSLPPLYRHDMIQQMVDQAMLLISRVAEREAAARELAEARDRALEASRHKSEFLARVSHEIRTPLNGIVGLNELLAATPLSERQRHLVSGVAVSSRTLLELINNVLDVSKIEAGGLEIETLDFEVRQVLAEVGDILADSREGDVELRISCSAEVPDLVAGDPTRLKQVLLNLGSNALKFTAAGSVGIRATADPGPDGGCLLRVEVTDTGLGMTPDQQDHVFAPFAQADTSTTRRYGGTGLGLAICAEIVGAFGGEIGVESQVGVGSTFWFTVPLGAATGVRTEEMAHSHRALAGTRVLVVDGDPEDRTHLEEQLGWWGVQPTLSASPAGALQLLAAARGLAPYDVVLVGSDDLADGLQQQGLPVDVPVVVLTADATRDDTRASSSAVRLAKPVSSAALRDALLLALSGPVTTARAAEPPSAPVAPPGARRGRVLVVEDNAINQMVARGFLEAMDLDVVTADHGRAALVQLEQHSFDAVLMDVQMPVLDGYATTRELRQREADAGAPRVPVLALTAAAIEGERERCLEAGMDDFLTKPLSPVLLQAALDRWVPRLTAP